MLNKIFRWLLTAIGLVVGYALTGTIAKLEFIGGIINIKPHSVSVIITYILGTLIFGIIFYAIAPFIIKLVWKTIELMESGLQKIPTNDIIIGVSGLIKAFTNPKGSSSTSRFSSQSFTSRPSKLTPIKTSRSSGYGSGSYGGQ
jgi:uncharacterized protein YacL